MFVTLAHDNSKVKMFRQPTVALISNESYISGMLGLIASDDIKKLVATRTAVGPYTLITVLTNLSDIRN